jgi:hypothetical protein
MIDDHPKRLR